MTLESKITANISTEHKETVTDISLPLHKHLCLWYIHTSMDVWHVTNQLEFFSCDTRFCMLVLAKRISFLIKVLLFHKPPEFPIVGASDIGQVCMAKSSIYFKYFYLLKILLKYFPFIKKEEVHKIFWILKVQRSKIQKYTTYCISGT